jgi:hypothetical protein
MRKSPWVLGTVAALFAVACCFAEELTDARPDGSVEQINRLTSLLEGARMRARLAEDQASRLHLRLEQMERTLHETTQKAASALTCDPKKISPRPNDRRLPEGAIDSTGARVGAPDPAHAHNSALRDEIWRLYQAESERQRRDGLDAETDILGGDGIGGGGGPKEISIYCPQEPTVSVTDLAMDEQEQGECLVMSLTAPELDTRLVINCQGELDDPTQL